MKPLIQHRCSSKIAGVLFALLLVGPLLASLPCAPVRAVTFNIGEVPFELGGSVGTLGVIPLNRDTPGQQISIGARLELKGTFGERAACTFRVGAIYDGMVLDPQDGGVVITSDEVFENRNPSMELDEAYFDLFFAWADVRIGKQAIVWGVLDEVSPVDSITPDDLTHFIIPDKEERRIGVPAVVVSLYPPVGDLKIEGLWEPVFIPYRLSRRGERWFPPLFIAPGEVDVGIGWLGPVGIEETIGDAGLPPRTMENSAFGFRVSGSLGRIDLGATFFEGFDTFVPTMRAVGTVDVEIAWPLPLLDTVCRLDVLPSFHRVRVYGVNVTTIVGDFTLRGEACYVDGRWHNRSLSADSLLDAVTMPSTAELVQTFISQAIENRELAASIPLDPDLEIQQDDLVLGLGVDYLFGNHILSFQAVATWLPGLEEDLTMEELEVTFTSDVLLHFMHENLEIELAGAYNPVAGTYLARPEAWYRVTDSLKAGIGLIVIGGDHETLIGQFHRNDEIQLMMEYHF